MTGKMKSCVKGLMMGCCGKPLPLSAKKEPVAWLYNGVRLPALPEWDREKYPYAVIGKVFMGTIDTLFYSASPVQRNGTSRLVTVASPHYQVRCEGNSWGNATGHYYDASVLAMWSTHDIINTTDGAVFLAASEPVPVYE